MMLTVHSEVIPQIISTSRASLHVVVSSALHYCIHQAIIIVVGLLLSRVFATTQHLDPAPHDVSWEMVCSL